MGEDTANLKHKKSSSSLMSFCMERTTLCILNDAAGVVASVAGRCEGPVRFGLSADEEQRQANASLQYMCNWRSTPKLRSRHEVGAFSISAQRINLRDPLLIIPRGHVKEQVDINGLV